MPRTDISQETRQKAKALRREPTRAERVLWLRLRALKARGMRFRRQAPIGPYLADFAWLSGRLVVEVDGDTHGDDDAVSRDRARDAFLTQRGFRVLRFSNRDVIDNTDGVAERILHEVEGDV